MIEEQDKINEALQLHQTGKLGEAKELYMEILNQNPDHANALYLLGMIAYQCNDFDKAVEYLNKAATVFPSADIYKLLGDIYYDLKEFPLSVQNYQKALDLKPDFALVYYNLGIILTQNKDIDGAILCYQKAIEYQSDYAEAYFNIADCLRQVKETDIAIACYQKVMELQPDNADAYLNLGNIYKNENKYDDAICCYEKAIELNPKKPDSHYNIGLAFYLKGDLDKAIKSYQKAISLNNDFREAHFNLGLTYYYKCEFEKSLSHYQRVLEINPGDQDIHINLGNLYKQLKQLDMAVHCYNKALELNPNNINALFNLGLTNILMKNFEQGWKLFEYRFHGSKGHYPEIVYSEPRKWDGSPLSGKTIYAHYEAGFGDTIQFVRYLPLLNDMDANVLLKVQPELEELLKANDLKAKLIPHSAYYESLRYDYFITLMSLPYRFNTNESNIPSPSGYLKACDKKVARYKKEFFDNNKLKIGFAWQRKVMGFSDNNNSIAHIKTFLPLLKHEGVQFYSLQKGEDTEQLNDIPETIKIINLGDTFNDFSDTAAAIENLDLVITIDNVLAHLAGAMNKPAWVLLPYVPNWRWFLDSNQTPWYDSVRLFRQTTPGNWDEVINEISSSLKAYNK